jgi:hypothetical protein
MIPAFPQLKQLALSDKPDIESFTRRFRPYSDFNFASMWCWDTKERVHVGRLAEHLVIQSADDATDEPFYSFLGRGGAQSHRVAEMLLARARAEGHPSRLRAVPQEALTPLCSSNLLVWEDRAGDDYIVDVRSLSLYAGMQFVHARRGVNKFLRACPEARVVQLDLSSACVRGEIDCLLATWTRHKGAPLPNEKAAMQRLLAVSKAFNLMGTGVYRHDRLIGFCIVELLADGYAMGHFAKCDTEFRGLCHFLYQATARAMSERGFRYFNVQEDLGIAGLRTFKMLLRPIAFLKKYAVTYRAILSTARFAPASLQLAYPARSA